MTKQTELKGIEDTSRDPDIDRDLDAWIEATEAARRAGNDKKLRHTLLIAQLEAHCIEKEEQRRQQRRIMDEMQRAWDGRSAVSPWQTVTVTTNTLPIQDGTVESVTRATHLRALGRIRRLEEALYSAFAQQWAIVGFCMLFGDPRNPEWLR